MSLHRLSTSTDAPAWPANALPERWIESLFERMHLAYGTRFADQWRGTDPKALQRFWAEKLGSLTADQLKAGVAKLDTLEWPPTLPQFLKLCQPAMDPLVAYYEAVSGVQARKSGQPGTWSHPAIYWAAMPMAYDLLSSPFSAVKVRWERALEQQLAKGGWEAIPEPALVLEAPGKGSTTPERAQQAIRGLQSMSMTSTGKDPKAWAHRIMERERRGDKGLTTLQVQFAREALGC